MRFSRVIRIAIYGSALAFTLLIGWRAFVHRPGIFPSTPVVRSQPAVKPLPVQTLTQSELILQLFNPTSTDITRQHSESALQRQIEEAMVIGYMLERCGMIGSTDYYDTYRALIAYAEHTGLAADAAAATNLIRALSASAGSSYALLYARTPCDEASLPATADKLAAWRTNILNASPPQ